jgi:UDP-N-acetylmuramoylalanine--D-glutamate ligase
MPPPGGRALVVGLGRSGLALARFLAGRDVGVRAVDQRPAEQLTAVLAELPPGAEVVTGGHGAETLDGCQVVFASPGVPWDAPLLAEARRRGLPVSSEIDLFFELCPAGIVGVTGTNGKTTTTAMVGKVLATGDRPVAVGGNIGETVLDRLPELTPKHWVVLELSSFQLESCTRPHARIGVVLNVTPDHLDRHGSLERYVDAKARLVEALDGDGQAVLNGQDPICRELAGRTRASVVWFDEHQPVPTVTVPGRHNELNALAAAAVGRAAGLDDERIQAGLAGFRSVEHRLELVGEWGGVRWFNDSKATNPDAGLVALRSFPGVPVVLIAGGHGSGFELDAWAAEVRRSTAAVVLLGESAPELEQRLAGHRVRRVGALAEAVDTAGGLVPPGGVVLLSPAYKSYDMFRSFEERGRLFKEAVRSRNQTGTDPEVGEHR